MPQLLPLQHYTLHHETATCRNCGRAWSSYTLYEARFSPSRPQDGKQFIRVSGGVEHIFDLPVHHHHEPSILIPICGPCAADRDNLSRLPPPTTAQPRSFSHVRDPKLEAWLQKRDGGEGRTIVRKHTPSSLRRRPPSTDADLDF